MAKITITITVSDPIDDDDSHSPLPLAHALEYLRQDAQGYFRGRRVVLTHEARFPGAITSPEEDR